VYYHGDYYQGDYYQGDPFIGALLGAGVSWLGKKLLGKTAAAAGKTAIARVGAGAATGIVTGAAGAGALSWAARLGKDVFLSMGQPRMPQMPGRGGQIVPSGCCPTGFHFNKSVSHAKATYGASPGTICVTNRSMNVANPRALRRGLRRVAGFGKLAMRAKKDVRRAAKSLGA